MIRIKYSSGTLSYKKDENIVYINLWHSVMGTRGGMKFYEGDIDLIADFEIGEFEDEIIVTSYPYNNKKELIRIAEKMESEIRKVILEISKKDSTRGIVTLNLAEEKIKVIEKSDFCLFNVSVEKKDELFIFDNPDPKLGFPNIFLYEAALRNEVSPYKDVFPILANMSRIIFPPIKPTEEGKMFTYMLINSFRNVSFIPETPYLKGIGFPTKLDCDPPMKIDTSKLEEFLYSIGTDKVKMIDGKVVDETPEDDPDLPPFMFDNENVDSTKLTEVIHEQIQEKESFNLGDAFTLGFEKVISMIPISSKIISVNIDFPGLVRKMCVFNGLFHIVPLGFDQIDRIAEILDIDEDDIRIDTDDTFPKKTPLLPSPSDVV